MTYGSIHDGEDRASIARHRELDHSPADNRDLSELLSA